MMQQPTCTNIRIRSVKDAQRIFYGVHMRRLHMITRRLDAGERDALKPGCIYVWEERDPDSEITGSGIERFTEGRKWSASRVRDEFLFYDEKVPEPRTHSWDRLIKQAYTAYVNVPDGGKRKWHLIAYFSNGTVDNLHTVDDLPSIKDLTVPAGFYQSKCQKRSKGTKKSASKKSSKPKRNTVNRTYASFNNYSRHGSSSMSSSSASESVTMHDPYEKFTPNRYSPPSSGDTSTTPHQQATLYSTHLTPLPSSGHSPNSQQSPHYPSHVNSAHIGVLSINNSHTTASFTIPPHTLPPTISWSEVTVPTIYSSRSVPRGLVSFTSYAENPNITSTRSTVYIETHNAPPVDSCGLPMYASPFMAQATLLHEPSYELSSYGGCDSDGPREGRSLAPIHALERRPLYHRDPLDDKALRSLPPA